MSDHPKPKDGDSPPSKWVEIGMYVMGGAAALYFVWTLFIAPHFHKKEVPAVVTTSQQTQVQQQPSQPAVVHLIQPPEPGTGLAAVAEGVAESSPMDSYAKGVHNLAVRGNAFKNDPYDPSIPESSPPSKEVFDIVAPPATNTADENANENWGPWIRGHRGFDLFNDPPFPSSTYRVQCLQFGTNKLIIMGPGSPCPDMAADRFQSTSTEQIRLKGWFLPKR